MTNEILELVKKIENIKDFTPPQELAIKNGLLEFKNIIVCSPTASGKTLIGIIAGINNIIKRKKKAVYLVPLRALANEKYQHLKEKYEKIGIKVGISTGDFDSPSEWLKKYDFIVLTVEKFDSIIRHKASWIKEIGCIIVDEIHLINDPSRGPTLEVLLTKIRKILGDVQIVGLSATIPNYEEIAEWLNAVPIFSNYRPVVLKEGVYYNRKIFFEDESVEEVKSNYSDDFMALIDYIINVKKKQCLIFVSSRKSAESLAERLKSITKKVLTPGEKYVLRRYSQRILKELDVPTPLCEKLSKLVENGVAFHHAGLLSGQRLAVEEAFRNGYIKIIVATPTLAMGVNLPATYVIVKDLKRFSPEEGRYYISVMEYKQLVGRAGRPQYDKIGFGIAYTKSQNEARYVFEKYVCGQPENVLSKLLIETELRKHVLALISEGFIYDWDSCFSFFENTLYYYQTRNKQYLDEILRKIILDLYNWGFIDITRGKNYKIEFKATKLGERVTQLYIDPYSAHLFTIAIKKLENEEKIVNDIGTLDLICRSTEMSGVSIKEKEITEYTLILEKYKQNIYLDIPNYNDPWFVEYLKRFKLAFALYHWINEYSEKEIMENFDITPGELYIHRSNAQWIAYSIAELCKILKVSKDIENHFRKMEKRLEHGVKEELLELVEIPNIGRRRARKLYDAGIKTLYDIYKTSLARIQAIVGQKTGEKVKKYVEELIKKKEINRK